MATYSTDLQTVNLADAVTGWSELSGHTSGAAPSATTETYIHNGTAIDQATGQATGTSAGMEYDYGSNISWTTGYVFLAWQFFASPTNIDTWANGGMRFGVGSSSGNIKFWNAVGSDFGNYPYGGWQNTAIDPTLTADATDGTPVAGNYRIFGSLPNMLNKITKGSPHVVDAIRYGRGQLQVTGVDATFSGMAAANDASTARWGLFQLSGGSYLWKGLMSLGLAGTSVTFSDSNKGIRVDDTPRVSAGFNKVEIRNASSSVTWTSISLTGVQTSITGSAPVSKGDFEVVDNATVSLDGCTFTDLGTLTFLSNTTVEGCTFRRTGQITTGGAELTGCLVTNNTASSNVLCAQPANAANISYTDLVSDGTGHGIEIQGTAANITLNGVTFTGYASSNGSTGNEAIYVNIASGSMSITIANGGTTPSIRTAGCSVTVVSGAVTVDLYAKTATGTAISGATVLLKAESGGPFPSGASVTIANSGTTATVTHTGHGLATNDKVLIKGASHSQNNGVFSITVTGTDTYTYTLSSAPGSSPTGTITSTFVVLSGTTDGNGKITMSRVFPSNQPVSGWARKSSSDPYYKTGPVTGTVNSSAGAEFTALLILDQ